MCSLVLCSAPLNIFALFLHRPVVRGSLRGNALKNEGCKAVAAVLPQTQIKELKFAPAHLPQHLPYCAHLSAPAEHLHSSCTLSHPAHSLANNNLTNNGEDMSGVIKLAEALPQSQLQTLKCAAAHVLAF